MPELRALKALNASTVEVIILDWLLLINLAALHFGPMTALMPLRAISDSERHSQIVCRAQFANSKRFRIGELRKFGKVKCTAGGLAECGDVQDSEQLKS